MFPASQQTLCLFAQFLSRSFAASSSIQNYVSGVKKLHLMLGLELPDSEFQLKLALKGLQRRNPHCPQQAKPMTPQILSQLYTVLDCTKPVDSVFWSLFLTAFFTLARKSNLVQNKGDNNPKQVTRGDIVFQSENIIVNFRWTKTIQCGERVLQVPMVPIPQSVLCPVKAYQNMVTLVPAGVKAAAFSLPSKKSVRPVTYLEFMQVLKTLIQKVGLDPQAFSKHSFRRGGATFAFKSHVPGELIKTQGDWRSEAYLKYLDLSLDNRMQVAIKMTQNILQHSL